MNELRGTNSPVTKAYGAGWGTTLSPPRKYDDLLTDPSHLDAPDPRFLASLGVLSMVTYTSSRLILQIRSSDQALPVTAHRTGGEDPQELQ
jgi:hypothetical protein